MNKEKQLKIKESLNWINSKIGSKDASNFKIDSLDYLRHTATYCILSLHNYQSMGKDDDDVYNIFKMISRSLQSAFGLDNVYYLGEGCYLVVDRSLDINHFKNKLDDVIIEIDDLTSEEGKDNGHVHAGFMNACPIDADDIDEIIELTKQLSQKDEEVNQDDYLNYFALNLSKLESYYQTDLVDPVTGLLDEKSFLTMAQSVVDYFNKENNENVDNMVIVYFNLINFKLFNDKYGYEKGNQLLKEFGYILREKFSDSLISRFEADHFYVMTKSFDYKKYFEEIQKISSKYNRGVLINVRGGICSVPKQPKHKILSYCDHAKLASDFIKKKNILYRVYRDTFEGEIVRQKYIIENFKQALEKDWIKLYYQPVVRTLNGKLTSMEVLARWQDPNYGLLAPYVFINTLEEYHLIHYLDSYIIRNVCKTYRVRKDNNLPVFPVSFNLSRLDFELCDIFQVIEDCAKEYRVPKSFLNIEITESVIIQNVDFIKKQIKRFHDAGYQVWMDDFGSEYSSLNALKAFDFDELKIDMKFLSEFNDNSKQIITSVVNMAKEIGSQTLAEGVETREQYEFLKNIGCEKSQGYLFSKPLPLNQMFMVLEYKNIDYEDANEISYLNKVGRVNMLSSHPFELHSSQESTIPLAMVEFSNDYISYLNVNKAFMNFLESLDVHSLEESEKIINDPRWDVNHSFKNLAAKLLKDEEIENFDFFDQDNHCTLEAKAIVKMPLKSSFLVHCENISANINFQHQQELRSTSTMIYQLFEHVYLIDMNQKTAQTIYASSSYGSYGDSESIDHLVHHFYEEEIFIEDKQRYKEFFNFDFWNQQFEEEGKETLIDFFRIRKRNGQYHWCIFEVKPLFRTSSNLALVTISKFEHNDIVSYMNLANAYPKSNDSSDISQSVLGQSLINSNEYAIFWKDTQHKFVGGNQFFKHYFELSNDSQFIGKTDKEMGWSVNSDMTVRDEIKVLVEGQYITDVLRQYIINGQMKNVTVSLNPVYNNDGSIIGLLGYFRNPEINRNLRMRLSNLENAISIEDFDRAGRNYVESYDYRHLDFAYVKFSIDNLTEFTDTYGYKNGEVMVDMVSKEIRDSLGFNSVIGHPELKAFDILHQVDDRHIFEKKIQELSKKIESINNIQGIRYNVYLSYSITYYSEVEEYDKMKTLGKSRLYTRNIKLSGLSKDVPRYNSEEIVKEMDRYSKDYDIVRIVDTHLSHAKILDENNTLVDAPGHCYNELGKLEQCRNCISRKTVATRRSHNKLESAPKGDFFVMSKYIIVDGREYSLELIKMLENKIADTVM